MEWGGVEERQLLIQNLRISCLLNTCLQLLSYTLKHNEISGYRISAMTLDRFKFARKYFKHEFLMRNVKPAFGGPPNFFLHGSRSATFDGDERGLSLCVSCSGNEVVRDLIFWKGFNWCVEEGVEVIEILCFLEFVRL